MTVPIGGLSLSTSIDSSCVMTVDTSTTSKLKLSYNDLKKAILAAVTSPGPVTPVGACPAGMVVTITFNTDLLVAVPGFHYVA
jgi:hypothetical protein